MKIALIRREYITHLDGVNRFIALLAEGLIKLGHDPFIVSLCNGVKDEVKRWFKEAHGLDNEIPIYTLRQKCGSSWLGVALDWWQRGTKLLREKSAEVAIVNGAAKVCYVVEANSSWIKPILICSPELENLDASHSV